jgi:hypothetical protein
MRAGARGLLTSKMRMPSKPGDCGSELHAALLRGDSTETNSRFCHTDTSCCEPGQSKSDRTFGLRGLATSMIEKPS